jgi:DNA-directed RNA polymerase specialized sigma24 family protein
MSTQHVPQHVLYRRAVELSRKIYCSLPWGYRVAQVFTVLAGDSLDSFGRVVYSEMIRSVVRGMPETASGKPAFDLVQDVERRGADALPAGYGRPFASRVFKILLSKFSDPEVVEDAMSQVLLQAARRKLHIKNGANLPEAESYIITIAMNAARDILRARGRRREESLIRDRDDEESRVDVEDPEAFRQLDTLLPAPELRRLLVELREVHPRAPDWLQAKLDGQSGQEIAEQWGTTPSYVSKWQRSYVGDIARTVREHVATASHYSYDRRVVSSSTWR